MSTINILWSPFLPQLPIQNYIKIVAFRLPLRFILARNPVAHMFRFYTRASVNADGRGGFPQVPGIFSWIIMQLRRILTFISCSCTKLNIPEREFEPNGLPTCLVASVSVLSLFCTRDAEFWKMQSTLSRGRNRESQPKLWRCSVLCQVLPDR